MNMLKSFVNNELIDHENEYGSCNRRNVHTSIFTYMNLFKIFGIDIGRLNHRKTKSSFVFTTRCLVKISLLIFLCMQISETFLNFKFQENLKQLLVVSILFIGSCLMWSYIINCEAKFTEGVTKLVKLETLLEVSYPGNIVQFYYLLFTTTCILIVCGDVYSYR